MSAPRMIAHLLLERLSQKILPRIPEADPIMAASDQINAFMESGRDEGFLTYLYFFHALMALPVIRPGDTVLDLACGPANQLALMARLNPQTHFIGIDASHNMLELARATLASTATNNVSLQHGDMTQMQNIATASIDCVLCTMSLHHLPDAATLHAAMGETRRVLKRDGGIYFADFGRLRRTATQNFFAFDRADAQSQQFTDDFLQSMRAAFSIGELESATGQLGTTLTRHATALAPFLLIFRSNNRRLVDSVLAAQATRHYRRMTRRQQRDFDNIARWFRLGGLPLPCRID
ncbi:MAG: class I SAM-dependent methyltransferase [Spongiibacteraceae bacterium]